jgi:hypothetical protein
MVYIKAMKVTFVCPYPNCSKSYVNSSILKRHIHAFHTTAKKFQCDLCLKCLASRQNLKEHTYTHTGEKPYICNYPGCESSFRQGTHLSAHKKFEHPDPGKSIEIKKVKYIIGNSYLTSLLTRKEMTVDAYSIDIKAAKTLPLITEPNKAHLPNIFKL